MNLKSILSSLSAWILLPALLLTATTWPGPLVGQDKPAPAADEEKDDEKKAGEKKGDDKQDGDVKADGKGKAPAGDKPSSSVEPTQPFKPRRMRESTFCAPVKRPSVK